MKRNQHGATAIEFALVLVAFLTFTLGIMDFARMLYMWNAAEEATRAGARYAAVCGDGTSANDGEVLARMQAILPNLRSTADIDIDWYGEGGAACTAADCQGVSVRLNTNRIEFAWLSPVSALASSVFLPTFRSDLPREVMRQDPYSNSHWCTTTAPAP